MVRKYTPTPEQRDERVNTEHDPEKLIRAVLKAGPHPKDAEPKSAKKAKKAKKSSRQDRGPSLGE